MILPYHKIKDNLKHKKCVLSQKTHTTHKIKIISPYQIIQKTKKAY
jgi:hypothetical protein